MDQENSNSNMQSDIGSGSVTDQTVNILPFPLPKRHKKRRTSKRKSVPANGKQNIRLTVTVERADLLIALSDERDMTTLALIRSYVDKGIEEEINRLSKRPTPCITENGISFEELVRKDQESQNITGK